MAKCLFCVENEKSGEVTGCENSVKCDDCGNPIHVGDWPYCPHTRAKGSDIGMLGAFVAYEDEHLQHEPVWVTSLGQRRQLMKANKLDYAGKKVGNPRCMV